MPTQARNPFFDIIEEESPQTIFNIFRPQGNTGSPAQRRFFQNSFNDIFDQYTKGLLGQAGQTSGEYTNLSDFLEANPHQSFSAFMEDFPFSRRFSNLTRSERGSNPAAFAPTTRAFF